jgi:endonuclease YncB( thermonuclease family)
MRRRRRNIGLAIAGLIMVMSALDHAGAFGYRGGDRSRYEGAVATVVRAVDGDTIEVDIPDGSQPVTRIRLLGVDCPEIAHAEGETDTFYGPEAAVFVREEVVGRAVRIALEPNRPLRDSYGRLLAYLYDDDSGEMVNDMLLARGLAYADSRFPHVFQYEFGRRERLAKGQRAGLWEGVTPERMPEWRRRMELAGAK